jgi:hypothetical protein
MRMVLQQSSTQNEEWGSARGLHGCIFSGRQIAGTSELAQQQRWDARLVVMHFLSSMGVTGGVYILGNSS